MYNPGTNTLFNILDEEGANPRFVDPYIATDRSPALLFAISDATDHAPAHLVVLGADDKAEIVFEAHVNDEEELIEAIKEALDD